MKAETVNKATFLSDLDKLSNLMFKLDFHTPYECD
jgi:hypothetical protein